MKILTIKTVAALLMIDLAIFLASEVHAQKTLSDGIKDLATQVATNVAKEQKQKIAVLPFRELDGQPTILGTYISEELVTDLFTIGGMEIVERSMLDKLIGELKLSQTGIIDPETAKKVGKIAGVDAVVTGSITDLQSYVALNCRLIDAQSGKIFGAAQTKIVKDDDLRKIMGTPIQKQAVGEQGHNSEHSKSTDAPSTTTPTKNVGKFSFELRRCYIKGSRVECELRITNTADDEALYLRARSLYGSSILTDMNGDQFAASGVSIGGGEIRRDEASSVLASGVPLRSRLIFDDIPTDTSVAKLIELNSSVGKVQFRDIPLSRP